MRLLKTRVLLFVPLAATLALGQETQPVDPFFPGRFSPVTLASQFFEHDYFNYYAFANGVYDSFAPVYSSEGQNISNGAFGYQVGGGASLYHTFRKAVLALSYTGSYRS